MTREDRRVNDNTNRSLRCPFGTGRKLLRLRLGFPIGDRGLSSPSDAAGGFPAEVACPSVRSISLLDSGFPVLDSF